MEMLGLVAIGVATLLGTATGYGIAFLRQQVRLQKTQLETEHQKQLADQQLAQMTQQLTESRQQLQQTDADLRLTRDAANQMEKNWVQAQEQIRLHAQTEARLREVQQQVTDAQTALKTEHGKVRDLDARLQSSQREMEEKIRLLKEAREQMKLEFQTLAQQLLEEKSEKFSQQNRSSLGELLSPLREQLGDFRKKIEDVYDRESRDRIALFNEIVLLKDLNTRMSTEALNLTRALKGDSKTQGNWGEMVLERVLEASGLQKGREYETQSQYSGEDGQRLRPDVVVHLPDNKHIVIDSKVSLTAWERFSAGGDDQPAVHLQAHVDSIKQHIRELSGKNYPHVQGLNAPDYVLMFVPIEPAFLQALQWEPDLFAQAFAHNIMLVCPSTLLVSLKTIHTIWRYEYQNRNAQEIAKQAGALHDQFVLFVEALKDVGDKLGKAQDAYDTAQKRLVSGKGNLVRRVQQLEVLGAKARRKMPLMPMDESEPEAADLALESPEDEALPAADAD